jgi:hypothetical protein
MRLRSRAATAILAAKPRDGHRSTFRLATFRDATLVDEVRDGLSQYLKRLRAEAGWLKRNSPLSRA